MTPLEQTQFAYDTGRFYQTLAQQIGNYLHQNITTISPRELSILSDDQTRLITYSNTFLSLATTLSFDGSDVYFNSVSNATAQITEAINHIQSVNDIITITGSVIGLAGGIVSQNGGLISGSLVSILKTIQSMKTAGTNPVSGGQQT
jgi:hypothetical protein